MVFRYSDFLVRFGGCVRFLFVFENCDFLVLVCCRVQIILIFKNDSFLVWCIFVFKNAVFLVWCKKNIAFLNIAKNCFCGGVVGSVCGVWWCAFCAVCLVFCGSIFCALCVVCGGGSVFILPLFCVSLWAFYSVLVGAKSGCILWELWTD